MSKESTQEWDVVEVNNANRDRATRPGWRAGLAFVAFVVGLYFYVTNVSI